MSWDESLFHWTLRLFKRGEDPEVLRAQAAASKLDAIDVRLHRLACALMQAPVDLRAAENLGGWNGRTLFLPETMDVTLDSNLNAQAYLYRIAHAWALDQLGLFLPDDIPRTQAWAATLVTFPAVTRFMDQEIPGVAELRAELFPKVLAQAQHAALSAKEIGPALLSDTLTYLLSPPLGTQAQKWRPALLEFAENAKDIETLKILVGASEITTLSTPLPLNGPYTRALKICGLLLPFEQRSSAQEAGSKPPLEAEALAKGTQKQGRPKENVIHVEFDESRHDENPLTHVFEKVQTAEEYKSGRKNMDGSDEIADHADALEELDLRHVIRSRERTQSLYKSDVYMEASAPDLVSDETPTVETVSYDEWSEPKKTYLKNWCQIQIVRNSPRPPEDRTSNYVRQALDTHSAQIRDLKKEIQKILTERQWQTRQLDGPEIDLDAAVDHFTTVRSGHSPSERLYLARPRRQKDLATLILLDSSLSSDSWVENQRVLDVSREAILILGEVLDGLHDRVCIATFNSNTRRHCHFQLIKEFKESWRATRNRFEDIEPSGYTRIGPALRHAIALLEGERARKKLILLISDGKPTDFDRYEGSYGIADVRQAIREAQAKRMTVRALAVDAHAKNYLPRMFGHGGYHILSHPSRLAPSLVDIYSSLLV